MRNNLWKKEMVLGIVLLFMGASIIPNISGYEKNNDEDKHQNNDTIIQKLIHQDNIKIFSTSCGSSNQQSHSDPPTILWNKTFGGNKGDDGIKIRKTTDDGFIVLGDTASFSRSNNDFWLLKIDENGNEEWNCSYGSGLDEFAMDVQQTSDGGYIIVGYFFFFHSHEQGIRIVKTNSTGIEMWNRTFGSIEEPADAFSVYQTTDGGFLIFGNDWTNSEGLYLIKIDVDGNLIWDMNIAGPGNSIYSISSAMTDDDGYVFTGCVFLDDDIDMFVMKLDSDFNKQWCTTIGEELIDCGMSVIQADNGKYVVVGFANGYEFTDGNAWMVHLDDQGNIDLNKVFEDDKPEVSYSVQETMTGYIVVGTRISSSLGDYDLSVILTDEDGNVVEKWIIGGNSYDEGRYVFVTSEDDYIIVGYTMSYGTQGSSDLWLLKIKGLKINLPPNKPVITGPKQGIKGNSYIYSASTTDPNGDQVYYWFEWGDDTNSGWVGPYDSGATASESHIWNASGTYHIKVKAKDDPHGLESPWGTFNVTMPKNKLPIIDFPILTWLFDHLLNAFPILRQMFGL